MKLATATLYDSNYSELANMLVPNKKEYCQKHNYTYFEKTDGFDIGYGFAKIKLIQEIQDKNEFDWIYFGDLDVVFMNFEKKLEDFIDDNFHCILSKDVNGINCGSMMVRCSEQGKEVMKTIMGWQKDYRHDNWQEQRVFIDKFDSVRNYTKIIPQKSFNSYLYPRYGYSAETEGNFSAGDCCLHLVGLDLPLRLRITKDILSQVIK